MWLAQLIFHLVVTLVQALLCIAIYYGVAMAMAYYLPSYIPGYDGLSALGDTQGFIIVLMAWDRFFGPTSRLLRSVATSLKAAQARMREYD